LAGQINFLSLKCLNPSTAAASEIHLAEGITIVRNEEEVTAASAEGAPRALDDSIFGRAARYLQSHSLKVDLKGADVVDAVSAVGRALNGDDSEEARAKGVKGIHTQNTLNYPLPPQISNSFEVKAQEYSK
jgi:Protein of unknown function (DUF1676)